MLHCFFEKAFDYFNLYWPPMHMRGTEATLSDTLHIVWAVATNIFMWLFMVFGAMDLDKQFRIYTIVSISLHIVFGVLTFSEAPNIPKNGPTPTIGIWERIDIFIQILKFRVNKTINKVGFYSGLIAFASTIAYVLVQLLQVMGILAYPLDEILIFGTSLCIVVPFVLEMLALHYATPDGKKFWSHAALIFTIIYSVFVTANYVVQLATVIPEKLRGAGDEIRVLEQTPHSMFWDFDALGYIFMGLAMLIALPVFERQGFQKWVRIAFIANAAVTPLITFVYFYPTYSEKLLFLGFPWGITAPLAMLMLAIMFKRNYKS